MVDSSTNDVIKLREATIEDCGVIMSLIKELSVYEKLEDAVTGNEEKLRNTLFGERRYAEVILAELNSEVVGFSLFFHNYSTFLTKPGIYLEDLYVKPEARKKGIGTLLLKNLAKIALQRGFGRLEWAVLDWNELAINFYKKLGATQMHDWVLFRVTGEALEKMGSE